MSKNNTIAMGALHTDRDKLLAIADSVGKKFVSNDIMDITNRALEEYGVRPIYEDTRWIAEEKKDGFSYLGIEGNMVSKSLSTKKGFDGQMVIKSGHVPHISRWLKYIYEEYGVKVHGELYKPGGTSDSVTAIMGCAEDKALLRQADDRDKLHFMIHDILEYDCKNIENEPWYIRRALLEKVMTNVISPFIEISTVYVTDVQTTFRTIVQSGGEGLIFKRTNGLYVPGKKPANNWVKCKREVTLDAIIMGINMGGSGKNKDLFKSLDVGLWDEETKSVRSIGSIHSGISDQLRKDIYEDIEAFKGRVIEVSAMEFNSKSWTMRHGRLLRFRDDKLIQQCTKDGIAINYEL